MKRTVLKLKMLGLVLGVCFFLGIGRTGLAQEDGFSAARKIEGAYFTVYCLPQSPVSVLIQKLNISPSEKLLAGKSTKQGSSAEAELADMLDTLFIQVCGLLDMHTYSYKGAVKVCADQDSLKRVYRALFGDDLPDYAASFYASEINTIYISADRFTSEVLGHEIAHAVISHCFVVAPSVKIMEILSGYVEYQLRKTSR